MIDVELGRDDHSLIAATAIEKWLKPLDAITNPRIRLIVKAKKKLHNLIIFS
jgi:hypothetical protein